MRFEIRCGHKCLLRTREGVEIKLEAGAPAIIKQSLLSTLYGAQGFEIRSVDDDGTMSDWCDCSAGLDALVAANQTAPAQQSDDEKDDE